MAFPKSVLQQAMMKVIETKRSADSALADNTKKFWVSQIKPAEVKDWTDTMTKRIRPDRLAEFVAEAAACIVDVATVA